MKKIILDLCGGTGSWSRPYAEAGYDVRLVTLPEQDVLTYNPPASVHGILAAPPCTMFSIARTTAKTPRDTREGMQTVEACLRIIWECQHWHRLAWWSLENPSTGLLRHFLGKPAHIFQPFQYGDAHSKRTALWGVFTIPQMAQLRLSFADAGMMMRKARHSTRRLAPSGLGLTCSDRRAITPPGFARAFFESNP